MKKADRVLGVCAVALALAIWIVGRSLKLTFITGWTPGPGFLPYVVSWGIGLCGILILALSFKKGKGGEEKFDLTKAEMHNWLSVIGSSVFVVATAPYLGLLTSMGIGVAAIAKLLGTESWLQVILVGVGSTVVFFIIFSWFLSVPLPKGPLGF